MSMISRQKPLPTTEELRFRQAIQCMTCLNPGQSIVECTLRTHCAICHSNAHTLDHCEYSLLNKVVASVRRIEPQDDGQEDRNRNKTRDDDRPRYDCYRSDRNQRDDYWWDDRYNDYRRDDDRRNDYRRDKIVVNMIEIIRQEMIEMTGGHIKVTDIMMIEGGMTIIGKAIVNTMMTEGMIIEDPKDLGIFNIILRVEIILNHRMFD